MKKPTFLLKPSAYKTNELYALIPGDATGDGNVSGYVGNGTRVNKDGIIENVATDTPRIDYYNGVGLLIEPTRTNACTYSDNLDFDWTVTAGALANNNTVIAPDGSLGADLFEDTSSTLDGFISKNITFTSATSPHAFSFFFKFRYGQNISLSAFGLVSGNIAIINIDKDGVITTTADVNSIVSNTYTEDYANGWKRFTVVLEMSATDTSAQFGINTGDYEGSGTSFGEEAQSSVWLWGVQLEDGLFSTSYIPTTTTVLTRTRDQITINNTITNDFIQGTNFSMWFDVTQEQFDGTGSGAFSILLGASNGRIGMGTIPTGGLERQLIVHLSDTTYETYNIPSTASKRIKALFNCFDDRVEVWYAGSKVLTTTAGKFMTIATDELILQGQTISYPTMKVHELGLYDQTLTDAEAQAITR